jgi:LysM repeat protein
MPARTRRDLLARYAAPAVFLLAVTVAILLVRSGLRSDGEQPTTTTVPVSTAAATTSATGTTPERARARQPKRQFYVIESGDTFGTVAEKFDTTVEALQALNPDASSNALSVGQRIRVK